MEELAPTELEKLKKDVREGQFRAITLDTSIFDAQGLRLEAGLLKQLEQFRDSSTNLIISEVVKQEILSHLEEKSKCSRSQLSKSLKQVQNYWCIEDRVIENIQNLVFAGREAEEIASERFDVFLELTSIEIIEAQNFVMVGKLLQMYFKSEPPFAETGKRKNEFPDAIALMSLDSWAHKNDTKVIVVTLDSDWKNFCKESKNLVVIDDLARALSLFQLQDADDICKYLSERHEQGEFDDVKEAILGFLESQVSNLDFYVEAASSFMYVHDWTEVTVNDYEFKVTESPNLIFRPVKFYDDVLVTEAKLRIDVNVECNFSFFVYDSIDKDEVPLGSSSASTQANLDVNILVSFIGNLNTIGAEIEVDDVEVEINKPDTIYFGEIEPDWMEDEDYDY